MPASCRAALIELGSECTVSGGVEGPSKDERELEELPDDMELDIVQLAQRGLRSGLVVSEVEQPTSGTIETCSCD